jgi:hypothetical protein
MRKHTNGLFFIAGGILTGAFSAYVAANTAGQDAVAEGSPWKSRGAALERSVGVYVQDYYLLAGRLPLASGQFIEAAATEDSDGNALSSSCTYQVVSTGPLPRWWSVAVTAGGTASTDVQTVIDDSTGIREADGTIRIAVSATPQPGNWLKVENGRRVTLHYVAVPAGNRSRQAVPPFAIHREGC